MLQNRAMLLLMCNVIINVTEPCNVIINVDVKCTGFWNIVKDAEFCQKVTYFVYFGCSLEL